MRRLTDSDPVEGTAAERGHGATVTALESDETTARRTASQMTAGESATVEGRSRKGGSLVDVGIFVGLIVGVIVIWQLVIVFFNIPHYILPTPWNTAKAFVSLRSLWLQGVWVTFKEIVLGFIAGTVVAIGLAALIVWSPMVRRVLYPVIVGTQAVPKIAVAPIFVVWFGLGEPPAIVLSALLGFFPVLLNTVRGLSDVDPALILLAKAAQAPAIRTFRKIRLPVAAPSIFTGLQLGITLSATGAIIGEFIAGSNGLGAIVQSAQGNQETARAFAGVVVIAILTIVLFGVVSGVGRLVVKGPHLQT